VLQVVAHTPDPLVAMAVTTLFKSCSDMSLCATPSTAEELRGAFTVHQPSVALVSMSKGIDWGFFGELKRISSHTYCVLWAEEVSSEVAHQALECGMRGVLRRSLAPEMLLKCVRKVGEGELWFEKSLTSAFLNGRSVKLSRREAQLMKLLSQGLKNKEIASALSISDGTVKVYLSKLYIKVGARDRFELALFGLRTMPYGSEVDAKNRTVFVAGVEGDPAPGPGCTMRNPLRVRA
jgi:two-component system, NarL family, nitrate/nitrite response regulator NarL